jgi:hypothetical protein
VNCWFHSFVRLLLFRTIHDGPWMLDREQPGREAITSSGILDSQPVKAPHEATKGYDAGKQVLGRKRRPLQDRRICHYWLKHLLPNVPMNRGKLMSQAAFREVLEIV